MARNEMRSERMRWIDLVEPTEAEILALAEEFGFHPLDLEDCRKKGQRQKVERYKNYAFLVLIFPVYNRKTREIESGEVDFFIGPDYVVTVDEGKLIPLSALRNSLKRGEVNPESVMASSVHLVHEIIERLLVAMYPMLDHLSIDIHSAEKQVFSGKEKAMVAEIALLRRNITDVRRIVQTHKNTLKRLTEILKLNGLSGSHEHLAAFEHTVERTKEIWDFLESYRESIDTIHETNDSLISFKLNDIMKTFTTMSVMIFVMTLVATIFAVESVGKPIVNSRFGFWSLLGMIALSGIVARIFFKRKRLLE